MVTVSVTVLAFESEQDEIKAVVVRIRHNRLFLLFITDLLKINRVKSKFMLKLLYNICSEM